MSYEYEVEKLKKKLIIFALIAVGATVFFNVAMENSGFFTCLFCGILCGLIFYIPGRLQQVLHLGLVGTITITVIFIFLVGGLSGIIGDIAFMLVFLPLVDMGYSIYKVVQLKKGNQPEEK